MGDSKFEGPTFQSHSGSPDDRYFVNVVYRSVDVDKTLNTVEALSDRVLTTSDRLEGVAK